MHKMKAHRVEFLLIDTEGYGLEDIISTMNNRCDCHIKKLDSQTLEIPSSEFEGHPLNKTATTIDEIRNHFTIPADGKKYVDRPLRPNTELESENEKLKAENAELKSVIRRLYGTAAEAIAKKTF
jgi:hypothetical protein